MKALDADLSTLPLAADAVQNVRCEVLDVTPTTGDASLPMQAVVQVGQQGTALGMSARQECYGRPCPSHGHGVNKWPTESRSSEA